MTDTPTRGSPLPALAGYLIGAGLALLLLLLLSRMLTAPPTKRPEGSTDPASVLPADEAPHLVVLAEFDDLAGQDVRAQLCALHRGLVELNMTVDGPWNTPVMVPPAGEGAPALKDLDALTAEELDRARPYLGVSGWLVPRVVSSDLKRAVVRAVPANKPTPELAGAVKALLARADFAALRLSAYSRALGLGDAALRERIDREFGVQVAIVDVYSMKKLTNDPEYQRKLLGLAHAAARERPEIRSIRAPGAFVHHAAAVEARRPELPLAEVGAEDWARHAKTAAGARVRALSDEEGGRAVLSMAAAAEGEPLKDLAYWLQEHAERSGALEDTAFAVRGGPPARVGEGPPPIPRQREPAGPSPPSTETPPPTTTGKEGRRTFGSGG